MPRSLSTGLRFVARVVFRSRMLRWALLVYLCFWTFDRAIEMATDAAWFASVGHSRLFWHQTAVRALLFWGWALPALALAVVTMRVVSRPNAPHSEVPALPPALARWDGWRDRVLKVGWLVLSLTVWVLGRRLAANWSEALQFWYGAPWDSSPWGARTGLWVFHLPFLATVLNVFWQYALVLFGVAGLCGGVRALPFLAARHMVVPRRWENLLLGLGAALLSLRALGYVLAALELPAGGFLRVGDAVVGVVLGVLGVGLCAWALLGLRRPHKRSRLGSRVGAALVLPFVLGLVLWPLRALGNGFQTGALEKLHSDATQAAWALKTPAALDTARPKTPAFERNFPLWDEQFLLLARGEVFEQGHVVEWRYAGTREVEGKTVGIVAGVPADFQSWSTWHDTDDKNANVYRAFDLQAAREGEGEPVRLSKAAERNATQTLANHFYGMNGPTLFGDGTNVPRHGVAGIPFESMLGKLAWAWRLRSPTLLFEGGEAHRLLVLRDLRQAAQKLAPMFAWDTPRPGPNEWTLEGYGATSNFPGAARLTSGPFQGANAGRPAGVMHLDPMTGALSLGAAAANPFVTTWKRALPELWSPDETGNAPFFALETASAAAEAPLSSSALYRGLGEPFWSVRGNKVVRVRRAALPAGALEKLQRLDAQARDEWKGPERLENGVPALWSDPRAPGGFWVARSYFTVSETPGLSARIKLKGVLLSALPVTAPVVKATTATEAVRVFEAQRRIAALVPDINNLLPATGQTPTIGPAVAAGSLEAQLSRALDEVEKRARASDWEGFGKALQQERALLQELARRGVKSATPTATAAP